MTRTTSGIAVAELDFDAEFRGWYSKNGEFFSDDTWLYYDDTEYISVVARFSEADYYVPSDADGDGEVDATAAPLVSVVHWASSAIRPI